MSKDYKRCPRCNYKTPKNFDKCGVCGLNFKKFVTATNAEAKSALRMGEKERVLTTTSVPSDVDKSRVLISCIFGGWFGLHFFQVGRFWRGIVQILSVILGAIYIMFTNNTSTRFGLVYDCVLIGGIIWAICTILWIADIIKIIFNRFKYPVSLPYGEVKVKKENKGINSASTNKGE